MSSPNADNETRRAVLSASGSSAALSNDRHALAATTSRRLDEQWIADALRGRDEFGIRHPGHACSRDDRHAAFGDVRLGANLVAHDLERVDARPDEHDPRRRAGLRKVRVLRQESVARVDRAGTGRLGGGHDRVDVEVAVVRGRRSDAHGDVGEPDVPRAGIRVAVDGDRADAHRSKRADDAAGDLAAIGDQDALEGSCLGHRRHIRNSPKAGSGSGVAAQTSSASPRIVRVSAGSMMPSSQRRAVE